MFSIDCSISKQRLDSLKPAQEARCGVDVLSFTGPDSARYDRYSEMDETKADHR